MILVFENYKNEEQLSENFGFIKRIRKKIPDTKIAFLSGESTPRGFKIGLIKRGVDAWIPYNQVNNIPDILKRIHDEKKVDFEGVLTKEILSK